MIDVMKNTVLYGIIALVLVVGSAAQEVLTQADDSEEKRAIHRTKKPPPPTTTTPTICHRICFNHGTLDRDTCSCTCPLGISGDNCEKFCHRICFNEGTLDKATCSCKCPLGTRGESCEKVCHRICFNQGTLDKATCSCKCPMGTRGESCEKGGHVVFKDFRSDVNWDLPERRRQYDFYTESTGCGGTVMATGGYQYGTLTSPNWPGPFPLSFRCTWTFLFFETLFFITDSFSPNMSSPDSMTFKRGDGPDDILLLGGRQHVRHYYLNLKRETLTVTVVGRYFEPPISIFWWSTPHAGYAQLYTPNAGMHDYYHRYFYNVEQLSDSIGYLFFVKTKFSGNKYEGELNITGIATMNLSHCGDVSTYVYHTGRSPGRVRCTHHFNATRINFHGSDHPVSVPFAVKIFMPKGTSTVAVHFRLSHKEDKKNETRPVCHKTCFNHGEMSQHTCSCECREGTYGENCEKNCPSDTENHDVEGSRQYWLTTAYHGASMNYSSMQCSKKVFIPSQDFTDYLFQVHLRSDIPLTTNCIATYLKIGNYRLCGKHSDYYVNIPFGNYLLGKTGAFFTNIVRARMSSTCSRAERGRSCHYAVNPFPSRCFRSHQTQTHPYVIVDLNDVYTVHAVGVGIEPYPWRYMYERDNITVGFSLVRAPYSEVICWYGEGDYKATPRNCLRPLAGKFLVVTRDSPHLTICKLIVLVNIAGPVVGWRNAAHGKTVTLEGMDNFSGNLSLLADEDLNTCVDLGEHVPREARLKFILYHSNVTVKAVVVRYKSGNPVTLSGFQAYGTEPCGNYSGQHGLASFLCRQNVYTKLFYFSDLVNIRKLCEVLIYTDIKVEFPEASVLNVALHKDAKRMAFPGHSLVPMPIVVDGNPNTCGIVDNWMQVDMQWTFFVHGIQLLLGAQKTTVTLEMWIVQHKVPPEPKLSLSRDRCVDEKKLQVYNDSYWGAPYWRCERPREGRFVVLAVRYTRLFNLTLCEIHVFALSTLPRKAYPPWTDGPPVVNVALHKHTRQFPETLVAPKNPSLSSYLYPYVSTRVVVDGIRPSNDAPQDTACVSLHYARVNSPWVQVDLANVYFLTHVQLYYCPDWTLTNSTAILVRKARREFPKLCNPRIQAMNCRHWARYVQVLAARHLCLCEVEVMAHLPDPYGKYGVVPEFEYKHMTDDKHSELFKFVEEGIFPERMFTAWYKMTELKSFTSPIDCGEILRPLTKTLKAPDFPDTTGMNFICHWMVPTPIDGYIMVTIEYLLLQNVVCLEQALIFSNSAGHQVTVCSLGRHAVALQSFQDSYLHITLVNRGKNIAHDVGGKKAFQMKFKLHRTCANTSIDLSTVVQGEIKSPFFPDPHPPFVYCSWLLKTGNQPMDLQITIHNITLYGWTGCKRMSLTFYTASLGVVSFCDNNRPPSSFILAVPANDTVTVVFKSLNNNIGEGFSLRYHAKVRSSGPLEADNN